MVVSDMICCVYFYVFDKILKADFHNLIPGTGCNCQLADLLCSKFRQCRYLGAAISSFFLADGAAHPLACENKGEDYKPG